MCVPWKLWALYIWLILDLKHTRSLKYCYWVCVWAVMTCASVCRSYVVLLSCAPFYISDTNRISPLGTNKWTCLDLTWQTNQLRSHESDSKSFMNHSSSGFVWVPHSTHTLLPVNLLGSRRHAAKSELTWLRPYSSTSHDWPQAIANPLFAD